PRGGGDAGWTVLRPKAAPRPHRGCGTNPNGTLTGRRATCRCPTWTGAGTWHRTRRSRRQTGARCWLPLHAARISRFEPTHVRSPSRQNSHVPLNDANDAMTRSPRLRAGTALPTFREAWSAFGRYGGLGWTVPHKSGSTSGELLLTSPNTPL